MVPWAEHLGDLLGVGHGSNGCPCAGCVELVNLGLDFKEASLLSGKSGPGNHRVKCWLPSPLSPPSI